MYCENCGNKLSDGDYFCCNCGTKIYNKTEVVPNNSNKTLWIIFGCVFGGFFLLFVLIMIIIIGIVNYDVIEEDVYDYEINDYIEDYEDIFSIDSF